MKWNVYLACATGGQHLESDSSCEDAARFHHFEDGWVGIVCDGAGSARKARTGSEYFATTLAALARDRACAGDLADLSQENVREQVLEIIDIARSGAAQLALARTFELRDLACTLVGCIVIANSACFFHIGDGYAVYVGESGESLLSRPENGEYSDQTWFVTDEGWKERLRVTAFQAIGPRSVIGLMSDGAAPFAIDRARSGFFRPFLDPIVAYLRQSNEIEGSRALQGVLEDGKTLAITDDDKTLLLALAG